MAEKIKDMTRGKPAGLIFTFALPLMLGNVFQQLYTVVDTAVVGQFVGVEALASIGAADWPNWMVLGIVTGFAQGFCILVSQNFGAGDYDGMRKSISHTFGLGFALALLITALAHLIAHPLLLFLNTPDDVIDGSLLYLRITFSGIIVIMAYNLFSSVLRALGDSKSPLYAMIIAALLNTGLDILFVWAFHWGIAGAAIATVIAQCCSALYCLMCIWRIKLLRLKREDWHPDQALCAGCWHWVRLWPSKMALSVWAALRYNTCSTALDWFSSQALPQPTRSTVCWSWRQFPMALRWRLTPGRTLARPHGSHQEGNACGSADGNSNLGDDFGIDDCLWPQYPFYLHLR